MLSSKNSLVPLRSIRRVTVFRDDFNHFDKSHYKIEVDATGGGNGEFQIYTPEHRNLYTANGYLYIKPTLTIDHPAFDSSKLYNGQLDVKNLWGTCTRSFNSGCHKSGYGQEILPPVMSGKVYTNAAIKYGRIDVRARLPKGDWLWPAIWLIPRHSVYGTWPRSGEIDVMEARGNAKAMSHGVNHGITQVASTLHWGPDRDQDAHRSTHNERHSTGGDWHSWHTYSLEWTAQHIVCLVDNHEILRVNTPSHGFWNAGHFSGTNIWGNNKNAPFDQPFQVLLNVAVGGLGFFSDHYQYDTPKPWRNDSPHPKRDFWEKKNVWLPTWHGDNVAMLIDYIEMIQY
ncbi:beta-1,3-glucan-binding protein-like [Saccostrea echinata]|uniref:beta-1,3-glucan-binding protein-like n=1 Tax=Saccostrea echinata TaxID=191078 RepID=UPI002A7FEE3E|nr:beta-1,3-glucan-binding protein-like [Saccostrea echinata]